MLFQPPFQQLLDTSKRGAAPAGLAWCITASSAGGMSIACCRPQSPSCSFFKLRGVSWVESVFWMLSHFLNTSTNSTQGAKGLSAHLQRNSGPTSTTWLSLPWRRCISSCFLPVFKATLWCVLLHLIWNFKSLLFWSDFRRQPPYGNAFLHPDSSAAVEHGKMGSLLTLLSGLLLPSYSCDFLVIVAVQYLLWLTAKKNPQGWALGQEHWILNYILYSPPKVCFPLAKPENNMRKAQGQHGATRATTTSPM